MTDRDRPPRPPASVVAANARRLELIHRKYALPGGSGLSAAEQEELNACAKAVGEWVEGARRAEAPPCPP